ADRAHARNVRMRLAASVLALVAACSSDQPQPTEQAQPPGRQEDSPQKNLGVLAVQKKDSPIPPETKQLLVAVVPGWDDVKAEWRGFERVGDRWKEVGEAWPAVVGVHGAAWG